MYLIITICSFAHKFAKQKQKPKKPIASTFLVKSYN